MLGLIMVACAIGAVCGGWIIGGMVYRALTWKPYRIAGK